MDYSMKMVKETYKSQVYDVKKQDFYGSNNIVVFLTIQYYCLSLRHE